MLSNVKPKEISSVSFTFFHVIWAINNYWMRLSMIARIIKAEVCVSCRSRTLRRITQTEVLIILAIMRKPNPIIVLLCISLSKCSMCSLNKKYHPLFELLHKTAALAHLQAFLSFEVHLLSFLSANALLSTKIRQSVDNS